MKTSLKILLSACMIALFLTVAFATIYQTRPVSNNVQVLGHYDFQLYMDNSFETVWANQDWGSLSRGESKQITRWIKNTGNDNIYVKWNSNEAELGYLTLTATDFFDWNRNVYHLITGGNQQSITFTLTVSPSATIGSLSFTIIFSGSDTGTD